MHEPTCEAPESVIWLTARHHLDGHLNEGGLTSTVQVEACISLMQEGTLGLCCPHIGTVCDEPSPWKPINSNTANCRAQITPIAISLVFGL